MAEQRSVFSRKLDDALETDKAIALCDDVLYRWENDALEYAPLGIRDALREAAVMIWESLFWDVERTRLVGPSLAVLAEKLTNRQAVRATSKILVAIENAESIADAEQLFEPLVAIADAMDVEHSLSILQSTVCVNDFRVRILEVLERKSGEKFGGDLWRALDWADKEGIKLDGLHDYRKVSRDY